MSGGTITAAPFSFSGIGASLPVWQQSPMLALQIVVPPLIALLATLQLAGKSAGWLRQWWQDYALLLIAALAVSLWTARAGAVAGALAAIPLGWQISQWIRNARNMRRPGKRVLALAGAALALLPAMPLTLLAIAMPAQASLGQMPKPTVSCNMKPLATMLTGAQAGEILAPVDLGAHLLGYTAHSVIAAPQHQSAAQMRQVQAIFTGDPSAAREMVRARGTAYVALCPGHTEPALYAAAAPRGLMAQLLDGNAPAWLKPISSAGTGGIQIWKIALTPA